MHLVHKLLLFLKIHSQLHDTVVYHSILLKNQMLILKSVLVIALMLHFLLKMIDENRKTQVLEFLLQIYKLQMHIFCQDPSNRFFNYVFLNFLDFFKIKYLCCIIQGHLFLFSQHLKVIKIFFAWILSKMEIV